MSQQTTKQQRQKLIQAYFGTKVTATVIRMRDEHSAIVDAEDSPRVKYFETFYLDKLRSGERGFRAVVNRVKGTRKVSLSEKEKKHIIKHLRLAYILEDLKNVPPVIHKTTHTYYKVPMHWVLGEKSYRTVYRNREGRFVKRP